MFSKQISARHADQIRRDLWALKREQERDYLLRTGAWMQQSCPENRVGTY